MGGPLGEVGFGLLPARQVTSGIASSMRRLLKWLTVFCLVLGLAVGGLLFRLSMGPLSLAPLQPILDTLVARGAPLS